MRVLHIIPSLGGGGAERQLAYLAEGMCRRGVDVHVALLRGGPYLRRVAAAGAHVYELEASSNYDPRLLSRTLRMVRAVRPDVLQTWLTQTDILGGLAALTLRIPWVLSERACPDLYGWTWKNALRRSLGHFADAIVANSAIGIEYWLTSHAKKFVVPNAVDVDAIDAATPAKIDGIDAPRVVLYVGRLESAKNVEIVVPALCDVVRTRNAVALICGEGRRADDVRAQIEMHGCADRFRMLGFTDAVWPLMKRADVLISPGLLEGLPNVVIEAAAAGCPLVLSDVPQHRALFDDRSATFAPPQDAAAFARAVESVLDDAKAAREKARRARAAIAGWSIERMTAEYLSIYEQLIS